MSLQPAMIQKPRGIDSVLCQCNLCQFTNLEAMTKCNVIVTSTVTETVRLKTPDRSGQNWNVTPPFCQRDTLWPRPNSESNRRKGEEQEKKYGQRETQRERQTDRQRQRQTDRQIQRERQADTERQRVRERERERQTDRQTDREENKCSSL